MLNSVLEQMQPVVRMYAMSLVLGETQSARSLWTMMRGPLHVMLSLFAVSSLSCPVGIQSMSKWWHPCS